MQGRNQRKEQLLNSHEERVAILRQDLFLQIQQSSERVFSIYLLLACLINAHNVVHDAIAVLTRSFQLGVSSSRLRALKAVELSAIP